MRFQRAEFSVPNRIQIDVQAAEQWQAFDDIRGKELPPNMAPTVLCPALVRPLQSGQVDRKGQSRLALR